MNKFLKQTKTFTFASVVKHVQECKFYCPLEKSEITLYYYIQDFVNRCKNETINSSINYYLPHHSEHYITIFAIRAKKP